jgi:hypothetical protein
MIKGGGNNFDDSFYGVEREKWNKTMKVILVGCRARRRRRRCSGRVVGEGKE